jgi:hypothetical protein
MRHYDKVIGIDSRNMHVEDKDKTQIRRADFWEYERRNFGLSDMVSFVNFLKLPQ